jgi:methanogenic corrinoid protein MtbC1
MNDLEQLARYVIDGQTEPARKLTQKMLDDGNEPQTILDEALTPAMDRVGELYERQEYFLPEMMASAQSMQAAMTLLRPLLSAGGSKPAATAILGTVKGDLHDIGKNVVGMMLEGAGIAVVDLGPDVAPESFREAVKEHKPDLVGMSALLTTTQPMMQTTIEVLEEAGVRDQVKVIIGGPPTSPAYAEEIGADGYAPDASQAVRKVRSLLGI